jgi:uncharacterized Zn-binding protein involved in type VI secretion
VGGPILPPCKPTVLIGGLPAARVGDKALCVGPIDAIVSGSTNVLIGGMPAARLGDSCAHGGKIVWGCMTVHIGTSGKGPGAGMTMFDATVGSKAQRLTFQKAKQKGAPFAEVCHMNDAPPAPPSPLQQSDLPPAGKSQAPSFSNAKKTGQSLVPVAPAKKGDPEPVFMSKAGKNMEYGDTKPSPSIQIERNWIKPEDKSLKQWGEGSNQLTLGSAGASVSSGVKITEDSFEADLIKAKAGVKAAEGKVGAEGEYAGISAGAEVLSAEAEVGAGVKVTKNEVYAGAKAGASATVAKVEGQGHIAIPIPFTSRKLILGVGGEASVGAKAEAALGAGYNQKYGAFVQGKAGVAAGVGLGANFILGIK